MKGKIILGLSVIALAVGSSGYAMEITKGKLLSHKEHSTGKIKATMKEMKFDVKKEIANFKAAGSLVQDNGDRIYVKENMYDASGITGQDTDLSGSSHIYIVNNTDTNHTYTINTIICAEQDACNYITDVIDLDPAGVAVAVRAPTITFSYDTAGEYQIGLASMISREDEDSVFTGFDMATAYISDQ